LVEHNLAKVGVAGSSPVSRSILFKKELRVERYKLTVFGKVFQTFHFQVLTFHFLKGGVPKWLRGRSAKPLCSGSNPLAASKKKRFEQCDIEFSALKIFFFENFDIKPVKSAVI
jgi:hypothetical protein